MPIDADQQPLVISDSYKRVLAIYSEVKKQHSTADRSPQKKSDYILPVSSLGFRAASCSFRGTTISDFASLILRFYFVNAMHNSYAISYGLILPTVLFSSADLIMTLIGSKDPVFQLCLHPNYREGIKGEWKKCKSGEYPKLLLGVTPFGVAGSVLKGYAGVMWLFNLIDSKPAPPLFIFFNIFAGMTGAFSGFCYLAFQISRQAFTNIQIKKAFALDENKEAIKQVRKKHWCSLLRINIESNLLTIASSLINGIAVFYSKGSFESNLILDVLASLLIVTTAISNIFYITNQTYENWYIKQLCEEQLRIQAKENEFDAPVVSINADESAEQAQAVPQSKKMLVSVLYALWILLHFIGAISAMGTGLALGPGFIHLMLRMTNTKEIENEKLPYCVTSLVFISFLAFLAANRDFVIWMRNSFPDDYIVWMLNIFNSLPNFVTRTRNSLPDLFNENKNKLRQTQLSAPTESSEDERSETIASLGNSA